MSKASDLVPRASQADEARLAQPNQDNQIGAIERVDICHQPLRVQNSK